jgi:hypothetical protein
MGDFSWASGKAGLPEGIYACSTVGIAETIAAGGNLLIVYN